MKEKRYFYNGSLSEGKTVTLDGDEFHHMANVMRAKQGDKICLINGDGNFYFSTIKKIEKKSAEIFIDYAEQSQNEPKIKLSVFQALAKGDKLSLIAQKITELGATDLCLFESNFSDIKSNTHKPDRLETIVISASKQCGRASILNIESPFSIKEVAQKISDYDAFFVAYENEDGHTLVDSLNQLNSNQKNIAVMIGPEGGFSETEIKLLKDSGADIVSLGKRILRTETASIASSAVILGILENNL